MCSRFSPRPEYIYIAFLVASIAVYAASFDNGFREDDFEYIRWVSRFSGSLDPFRASPLHTFYRPGAMMLFWMAFRVFGPENSGAYIALNFAIHVLSSICLIGVLRGLRIGRPASCLAGGLFVLGLGHYGKKVMWACTCGPLSAILLVLCSLRLMQRHLEGPKDSEEFRMKYLIAAGLLMLAAPAFHEIGLIAPILVIALLVTTCGGDTWRRGRIRTMIALSPVIVTFSVWLSIYRSISIEHEQIRHAILTCTRAPLVLFRHLGFMLLPIKPSPLIEGRPGPIRWLLSISTPLHTVIAAAIIAASLYLLIRGNRAKKFLVIWMYVAIIPFCLVDMPEGWLELRYLYCAAMPLCALIALILTEMHAKGGWRRGAAFLITGLAAVMTIYVTAVLEKKYDSLGGSPDISVPAPRGSVERPSSIYRPGDQAGY